jgi:hypothetical protein
MDLHLRKTGHHPTEVQYAKAAYHTVELHGKADCPQCHEVPEPGKTCRCGMSYTYDGEAAHNPPNGCERRRYGTAATCPKCQGDQSKCPEWYVVERLGLGRVNRQRNSDGTDGDGDYESTFQGEPS